MEIRTLRRHWVFILAIAWLFMGGCPENYELPQLVDTADAGDTDTDTGVVVPCTETCEGETPYCDEGSGKCVECVESSHCDVPSGHNYAGVCENNVCGISCAEGYQVGPGQDFEQDGCQCATTDLPDLDGIDSNCDGVDGVLGEVVFVSADASSTTDRDAGLTPEKPVSTIQQGIALAKREGISYVLVAKGEYVGKVTLVEGISIYGGYDSSDWGAGRNVGENPTELVPYSSVDLIVGVGGNPLDPYYEDENAYKTVVAHDIEAPTVLSGLTIYGASSYETSLPSGASTFAVWALNSPGLKIEHGAIVGGNAFDGKDGEKGETGADGAPGDNPNKDGTCQVSPGGKGGAAADSDMKPCQNEGVESAGSGFSGHDNDNPDDAVTGGPGGKHVCKMRDSPDISVEGKRGQNGAEKTNAGAPGHSASEGDIGVFTEAGHWVAPKGKAGLPGQNGGGGGGGGASGNFQESEGGGVTPGSPGGHGGGGGCRGGGGKAGQAGGSSFGLAVIGGKIELESVKIRLGKGGKGGNGGEPGHFGSGGPGQQGTNSSGTGGRGSDGTEGGTGSGGDGGHSVGVALAHGATLVDSDVTFWQGASAAQGGNGVTGYSPGKGKSGLVVEVFPPEQE